MVSSPAEANFTICAENALVPGESFAQVVIAGVNVAEASGRVQSLDEIVSGGGAPPVAWLGADIASAVSVHLLSFACLSITHCGQSA